MRRLVSSASRLHLTLQWVGFPIGKEAPGVGLSKYPCGRLPCPAMMRPLTRADTAPVFKRPDDMFVKSEALAFFPTFVWVYDLKPEDAEPLSAAIAKKIDMALPSAKQLGESHSLQSGTHLHELPEFQLLIERVQAAAQQILKFLKLKPAPLKITGCWANVSGPAGHHKEHAHSNNFLSGVYYVKTPEGGDSINFHDPRAQAHVIAPHVTAPSTKQASTVIITVKPGRLVIFPAWLRHSVDPNLSQEPRMSISFNLMFDHFADEQSHPRFEGEFLVKNKLGSV